MKRCNIISSSTADPNAELIVFDPFQKTNLTEYAQKVSEMTDAELLAEGRGLHRLVYSKRISGNGPSSFELRLEICRTEYRKRRTPVR